MRALTFVLASLLAGYAWAGVSARADGPTLFVNEIEVVTVKTGGGGFSPEKRAQMAAEAIRSTKGFEVSTSKEGAASKVMVGGLKVLTVTADEARAHGRTVDVLTATIADKLKKAVDSVAFFMASHKVWMPVGGTATVALTGPAADKTKVTFDTFGPAKAEQREGTITISAEYAGSCSMTVRYGEKEETLTVVVLMPAAVIGIPGVATVTGRPADKATVASAATRAALAAITAAPNAQVTVDSVVVPELVPSQRGTGTVKATVRAPDRFPVEATITVELKNTGMLENATEELWYSNHPETVRGPGRLYWGKLGEGKAARVLYHHLNLAHRPLVMSYALVNTSDVAAKVAVTLGDSQPHTNPTYAGYMAGEEFFPRWVRQSASIVEVPPHSIVPVVVERFSPQQVVSGLMAIHSVEGPSVLFIGDCEWGESEAGLSGNYAATLPTVSLANATINLTGQSQHVYSPAVKTIKTEYELGGRFGYIRIGEQPVGRVDDSGGLSGNFGIVYQIEVEVYNPTLDEAEIEFVFESSAGYTGAFFRINEIVYRTPLLQPKKTHRVTTVRMAPGERKTFYLETIPLSGGSYPVTVTIKPIGVG